MKLSKDELKDILKGLEYTALDNYVTTFDKYNIMLDDTSISHEYQYCEKLYFYDINTNCLIFSVVFEENEYIIKKLDEMINIDKMFDCIDWCKVDNELMSYIVGIHQIESNYFEEDNE